MRYVIAIFCAALFIIIALSGCAYQGKSHQLVLGLANRDMMDAEDRYIATDATYIQKGINDFWNSPTTLGIANVALSAYGVQQAGRVQELEAENAALRAEIERLKAAPVYDPTNGTLP